jgi:hypothetical protein
MLVAYAGKEPVTAHPRYERAYELFRRGRDTSEIAEIMRITEGRALRYVTLGRSLARSLPNPYQRKE